MTTLKQKLGRIALPVVLAGTLLYSACKAPQKNALENNLQPADVPVEVTPSNPDSETTTPSDSTKEVIEYQQFEKTVTDFFNEHLGEPGYLKMTPGQTIERKIKGNTYQFKFVKANHYSDATYANVAIVEFYGRSKKGAKEHFYFIGELNNNNMFSGGKPVSLVAFDDLDLEFSVFSIDGGQDTTRLDDDTLRVYVGNKWGQD